MTYGTLAEKRPSTAETVSAPVLVPTQMARILIVEDNVNLAYGLEPMTRCSRWLKPSFRPAAPI